MRLFEIVFMVLFVMFLKEIDCVKTRGGKETYPHEKTRFLDPQQTREGASAHNRIDLRHPQQQPSSPGGTPGLISGYLADPSSDDDYKESELAQNPQRTEGGSHTRGKILHKQTSRQEVNTHTTLKKSSRIAVQQTKNAQRGRQSGACEGSASTGYLADPSSDDDYQERE
uniref:Secreted protein n=1 Tax=Meloidogyne javanica TaxID=6303 RepID=A0A915N4L4_MELJA